MGNSPQSGRGTRADLEVLAVLDFLVHQALHQILEVPGIPAKQTEEFLSF